MSFGLKNVRSTFQRVMDIIQTSGKWQFTLVHPDNTVTSSRTLGSHINHTQIVLSILKEAGVSLELRKCTFFIKIDYLGDIIRTGRLEVADHTADDTCDLKILKA